MTMLRDVNKKQTFRFKLSSPCVECFDVTKPERTERMFWNIIHVRGREKFAYAPRDLRT